MAKAENELTPMKRQYNVMKEQHPDSLLFFRLGDFYEMFDDDARIAAKELDLTLTTRDRGKPQEEQTPMCGVPYHSVEAYIGRLVARGYKVAICEQTQDPATAKGLVSRDVIRIVTPGTVTESSMLEEGRNNYICVAWGQKRQLGLALCDVSTGAFYATICADAQAAVSELGRFSPKEAILEGNATQAPELGASLFEKLGCCVDRGLLQELSLEEAGQLVQQQFHATLAQLGLESQVEVVMAAGGLLKTLMHRQRTDLSHIRQLEFYTTGLFMELDMDARRNLELTQTLRSQEKRGSLLWVLDKTLTPMGGRMLRSWLDKPLLKLSQIQHRHSAVEALVGATVVRGELQNALKGMTDLERVMTRVVTGSVNCRDLLSLGQGLHALPAIRQQLTALEEPTLQKLAQSIDLMEDCLRRIDQAIVEDPPLTVREGGIIRAGIHPDLDHFRDLMNGSKDTIAAIEAAEKEATGIRTLKIGYNRIFGYYIEVSRSFVRQVPAHYVRKQTLVNCERYTTPELKDLENQILNAKEQVVSLEYAIFQQLCSYLSRQAARCQETAAAVAAADCLCSLAAVAVKNNYCRPQMTLGEEIRITDGRHPVVEQMLTDSLFVPNDTHLGSGESQVAILTGPNMAGKSTYMRQVALIVLMAQIGSFVPARSAQLGIVDRVFTRIGASDDLAAGQSTFMVEMAEVASILKHATSKSLLILDEIGRGTSTYDGMSIAQAVLEYVADPKRLGAKTLFATHYHELAAIEGEMPGVKNYNIAVRKRQEQMIFLRKIVPGATDDSYGIEVAKLAGLPAAVTQRATQILGQLEQSRGATPQAAAYVPQEQVSMQELSSQQLRSALEALQVEMLTPIEAINELYKLKKML